VRSPKVIRKKIENHSPQIENSPRRKPFKAILQEDKKLFGTFIQIGHPVVTEFVGKLGFDFLIIDSEHSAMHIEIELLIMA
jgi:2-keto-3-deoxy-L-rhamnonate aldolase RhmA